MSTDDRRKVINLSINPRHFDEVHDVLDTIKKKMWPTPVSFIICRLLLEFAKRGFKFESEVE